MDAECRGRFRLVTTSSCYWYWSVVVTREPSSSAQLVGALLRARRHSLSPADVGLPAGSRRRTTGLRREEVAQLANISSTYYTFLEQGRDIRPSRGVLDSLASALRLDADGRSYLYQLAAGARVERSAEPETLAPGLAELVEHLDPRPTYVTSRYWDVLAANRAARSLWTDWTALPLSDRNLLWWTFTAPAARDVLVDWEVEAARLLASFRLAAGRRPADPGFGALLQRLQDASPEVRDWWPGHDSLDDGVDPDRPTRLRHPELGVVELRQTALHVADELGQLVVTFEVGESDRDRVAALVEDFSLGVVVRAD
jgi:transcriptional regulator with XRE-family HTH domain